MDSMPVIYVFPVFFSVFSVLLTVKLTLDVFSPKDNAQYLTMKVEKKIWQAQTNCCQ